MAERPDKITRGGNDLGAKSAPGAAKPAASSEFHGFTQQRQAENLDPSKQSPDQKATAKLEEKFQESKKKNETASAEQKAQAKALDQTNKSIDEFIKSLKSSTDELKDLSEAYEKLSKSGADVTDIIAARNKLLAKVLQDSMKLKDGAKIDPKEAEKFADLTDRLVAANLNFTSGLTATTTGLADYVKGIEDAVTSGAHSREVGKKILTNSRGLLKDLSNKSEELIKQMYTGMIDPKEFEAFIKALEDNAVKLGSSAEEARKQSEEFRKQVDYARAEHESGNTAAAYKKMSGSYQGAYRTIALGTSVLMDQTKTLDVFASDLEKKIRDWESKGKGSGAKAALARLGARLGSLTEAAGGKGIAATGLGKIQESKALNAMTGGAAGTAAGKFLTSEGTLNKGAVTSAIFNHITDTLAKDRTAYRDYGREFGTGGTGAMDRAAPWVGHQGRMAKMGLELGVGGEEAHKAFGEVAKTYRVGESDPKKRYEQMQEITKETIKQANLTGLSTAEVTKLGAAYRDNLGKSVKESSEAGYKVAVAMKQVNKDITNPDLKASNQQIADLLGGLASDSEVFGKNINEVNHSASKAAEQFMKMGINLAKAKEWAQDVAKLTSGARSLTGGMGMEMAMHGDKFMNADQGKLQGSVGGAKNVEELKSLIASGDHEGASDRYAEMLEANGKKEEAQRWRDTQAKNPNAMYALSSMITGDKTHMAGLGNEEGQRALDETRGAVGGTMGLSQYEVMKQKAADIKEKEKSFGSSQIAGLLSKDDRRSLSILRKADAAAKKNNTNPEEEYNKLMKQAKEEGGEASKGEAGIRTVMDLKGTLEDLKTAVLANTVALVLLTGVMALSAGKDILSGGKSVLKWGGSKLGNLGGKMAGKGGRIGKAGEFLSKKFGGTAAEGGAKLAAEAGGKIAGAGEVALEGAEVASKGSWFSNLFKGGAKAANATEAGAAAADVAGVGVEGAKAAKTMGALSKLKALSGVARTAAAETGLLEVAIGGFSMAAEGSDALKHKSGHYLGEQNKEMGSNWHDLMNEKGAWNTTLNAGKVLGSGLGYIGTATKELALPGAKAADWALDKSGAGGVMNGMGTLLMGSSYSGQSRTDLVKDKWSSLRNFVTTGKMESDQEKKNREAEETHKKKMDGRAALKSGDHAKAKELLGEEGYNKEVANMKKQEDAKKKAEEDKKKAEEDAKKKADEQPKTEEEKKALTAEEKKDGEKTEGEVKEGKETSKISQMTVDTMIVKNFKIELEKDKKGKGSPVFGKPHKHKRPNAAGMTPEEMMKFGGPEAFKAAGLTPDDLKNLSPEEIEKRMAANPAMKMLNSQNMVGASPTQLVTPYESLAGTDKLLSDSKPGTAGKLNNTFDADMSYDSGRQEIIFKVANAQKVLSGALAQDFRHSAPNPQ